MLLLEVASLTCALRRNSIMSFMVETKRVLDGVSLTIEEGGSVALLGASGSGKSTLARCIVGLHQPDSGTMTFEGVNIFPEIRNRKAFGLEIQMLFQGGSASLDPTMRVLDSLMEGITARRDNRSTTYPKDIADQLVLSVGLPKDCLDRLPAQLSGGQRQRIALARLLAVSPRLLILDEPTSALDALTSAQLLQLLKSLQAIHGFALLYITHDVQTALSFCNRVAVLHNGIIVEEGSSEEIHKHPKHHYTTQLLRDSKLIGA